MTAATLKARTQVRLDAVAALVEAATADPRTDARLVLLRPMALAVLYRQALRACSTTDGPRGQRRFDVVAIDRVQHLHRIASGEAEAVTGAVLAGLPDRHEAQWVDADALVDALEALAATLTTEGAER